MAWTEGARPRPRIAFGAPLPVGMAANAELIDVVTTARWPAWRVREALDGPRCRPVGGWSNSKTSGSARRRWPGGSRRQIPARTRRKPRRVDGSARGRGRALLAAPRLPRERAKGDGTVEYDLRPLLIDVAIEAGPPVVVTTRTRFHPELGTGRPEEVVAALGERLGAPLEAASIVRERLVLSDDLD